MFQSDPLSQWIKNMFPSQATAIVNHHYVHTAVNTKSQIFKKFSELIRDHTKRMEKFQTALLVTFQILLTQFNLKYEAYLVTTAVADGRNSNSSSSNSSSNNNNNNNNNKLPLVWHKELQSESKGLTTAN